MHLKRHYRDVRRATLLNLPLIPATLPAIITRTRDIDPAIRKAVFSPVLTEQLTSPKQLSIAQREHVVRSGLGDREPSVRTAATALVGDWLTACESDVQQFVGMFDVEADGEAAEQALLSVLETRPDIADKLEFGGKNSAIIP